MDLTTVKRGRLVNKTIKEDSNGVLTFGQVKQDLNDNYYYVDQRIGREINVEDNVTFLLVEQSSTEYAQDVTKVGAKKLAPILMKPKG